MKFGFNRCNDYIATCYIFIAVILGFILENLNLFFIEIALVAITLLLYVYFQKKLIVNKVMIVWMFSMLIATFSIFYSVIMEESGKICILFFSFIWMSTFFSYSDSDNYKMINFLCGCCGMHVVFSLWQYFNANTFYKFYSIFANGQNYADNVSFYRNGRICGITSQTGANGFYISIFIIIVFDKLLKCNKIKTKFLLFTIIIISYLMLICTGKRAYLLGLIFVLFAIWYIYNKGYNMRKKFVKLCIAILAVSVFAYVMIRTNAVNTVILKFVYNASRGDITNGRIDLWRQTIDIFKEHFIFGTGIKSIPTIIGEGTHNVYIQLLAEVGIFGALFFYGALFYPLIKIVNIIWRRRDLNMKVMVSFSIQLFFLIYCLSGNPLYDHKMMWIYAVAIGFAEREIINYEAKKV